MTECFGYKTLLNDVTDLATLEEYIIHMRHAYITPDNKTVVVDEGMVDAACRALANEKSTSGLTSEELRAMEVQWITTDTVRKALENVKHCVVGVLEDWENTRRIINFWSPWIDAGINKVKMRLYNNLETLETLRPDIRLLIERYNQCDLRLYAQIVSQFRMQLGVLKNDMYL